MAWIKVQVAFEIAQKQPALYFCENFEYSAIQPSLKGEGVDSRLSHNFDINLNDYVV
ncbi:acetoin dehydrogenase subunit alpha [Kingella kingae ATCC 23330]|uniref:Acetoin dehydrogenase subunit alpha n=1 Tax=Kingella kingae ATCC 23330 TaxID=887327 RepID=F5S7U9_KINKI|nr:acetoin dehydrogenase subunit alpha [Kingella kingae ATCC 23330]